MRITSVNTAPIHVAAALALLCGCAGDSSPVALPNTVGNSGASLLDRLGQSQGAVPRSDRTGIASFFEPIAIGMPLATPLLPIDSPYKELAVTDASSSVIDILGPAFRLRSTLSHGLSGPVGDWIDDAKNLYVADYSGVHVQEYAPGSSSPTFTYSAGLVDPVDVTTDSRGNVYVADFQADRVVEYAQGVNTVIAQCKLRGGVEGIAVDSSGNVFASYNKYSIGVGRIVEFSGGLSACAGTTLKIYLGFAGGLRIANDGTLVAANQYGEVYLIPKPYTAIASTIIGAVAPFHVALTKFNKLLFIADPARADVLVVHYPSGRPYLTLGAANGLRYPTGVAVYAIGQE